MSSIGKVGVLGACGTGLASATGEQPQSRTERSKISDARANKILGQINSEGVYRETRKFIHEKKHRIKKKGTEGYWVNRADGKKFFELRIPVNTQSTGSGLLRVMTDQSRTNTQINLPSGTGDGVVPYFCDQTTLQKTSGPVKFRRWIELHEQTSRTASVQTNGGVSTSQTSPPNQCVPLGGSDVCAAIDLLGIAAGAIVAVLEPGPLGELTIIQKIGTAGSVFGATASTCSALELADGLVDCESDKYYICPDLYPYSMDILKLFLHALLVDI